MALIIANSKFLNSNIEITNAYLRLTFMAQANGKDMVVNLMAYENKEKYITNKVISLEIPTSVRLTCNEGEQQDLIVAHNLCKTFLEQQGYVVTIDLT